MVRRCCIPFCRSGMKGGPKVSMFAARADNFEKWKEAIEEVTVNYKVTRKTAVCMLHFKPDEISTHDEMIINGKLVRMKRILPRLKPDAYPTIFSHIRNSPQKSCEKSLSSDELGNNILVERFIIESEPESNLTNPNLASLNQIIYTTNILEDQLEQSDPNNCCILQPFVINTIYKDLENVDLPNTEWVLSQESGEEPIYMIDSLISQNQKSIDESNFSFTVNTIHKEAKNVKLPNSMWAVCQETAEKTIFLHCSKTITVDKAVIFTESCLPEIKFKKKSLRLLETEITTLLELEKLIQTVDTLRSCEGTGLNHSVLTLQTFTKKNAKTKKYSSAKGRPRRYPIRLKDKKF